MANPQQKRQYDNRIDLLKGIAIFGVACIHFGGSFVGDSVVLWTAPFYVGLFLNQFFSFSVALFIFLSGWLLEYQYTSRPFHVSTFYRRRLIRILIPYTVVVGAYFVLLPESEIIKAVTPSNFLIKFFYYGVQGTQYFISLILQLYIVYPVLRWIKNKISSTGIRWLSYVPMLVLIAIHGTLGFMTYSNKLDYYTWCRPFSLFWMVFFYGGMVAYSSRQSMKQPVSMYLFLGAVFSFLIGMFILIMSRLLNPAIVGMDFGKSMIDYAYSRPEIMFYNIIWIIIIAFVLRLQWSFRAALLEQWGKNSYTIYLWHILFIYYIAWNQPVVLETCRNFPEVIVFVCIFACMVISAASRCIDYAQAFLLIQWKSLRARLVPSKVEGS